MLRTDLPVRPDTCKVRPLSIPSILVPISVKRVVRNAKENRLSIKVRIVHRSSVGEIVMTKNDVASFAKQLLRRPKRYLRHTFTACPDPAFVEIPFKKRV